MLFSVEYDHGSLIRAYVIPDSAGTAPRIRLRSGCHVLAELTATDVRPEIVASGRHATGQCGFMIDDTTVANLASYSDLEIVEAASDLRIYRRKTPAYLDTKVFRLETHLLRLHQFDEVFKDNFQYWYPAVDFYGSETSSQVFHIYNSASAYISGRLLLSKVQADLDKGYRLTAMIRDPFDELAERLIFLKKAGPRAAELLGARDALSFEPVIDSLTEIDAFDRGSCKRFFKHAGKQVLSVLSNPLCRQLTANSFEELLTRNCLIRALQALSSFEILGLRSDAASYARAVAETFAIDPTIVPVVADQVNVVELGSVLRELKDAELLLEHDLELFEHMLGAFGSV